MGQLFEALSPRHLAFIEAQKIYFVGTAAEGTVNLSPKGGDSLRILDAHTLAWLNLTGSGNESAAHVLQNPRMTVMFCAFDGAPRILRLYGIGRVIGRGSGDWDTLATLEFDGRIPHGARQMIWLDADLVQTSCGYGVPLFDFVAPRDNLDRWAAAKSDAELEAYRREKNAVSMDGLPTGLFPD